MTPPVPGPAEGLNAAVAAQLRAEIAAANLSDKALAAKAGVRYGSLRRWLGKEAGNERNIDVALLGELARALEIPAAVIVSRATQRMIGEESPGVHVAEDAQMLTPEAAPRSGGTPPPGRSTT